MDTVELSDGSVLLRPYGPSDVARLHKAARESSAEVWQWMEWCHPDLSADECREFVERQPDSWAGGTGYSFAITEPKTGLFLGGCGLTEIRPADRVAGLAYWVRTSRTGEGIATAIVPLLAGFAFGQLGMNRIEIVIAVGNPASRRVAEKAGATQEGILRNRYEAHGKVQDAFMYSLIPSDLR